MKRTIALLLVFLFSAAQTGHATGGRVKVYSDFDKPVVQTGRSERVVLRVGLSAGKVLPNTSRLPINLAIVLDRSGSMGSQGKIENARSAAIDIIERLGPADIVALVAYDTAAQVIIPAQHLTDKDRFIDAIGRLTPRGSTALYDGTRLGAHEVLRHASGEFLNRVILLSDGLANQGPQSTPEIAGLGNDMAAQGISVTTVGVGTDYNEDLMGTLASTGGGNVYFAKDSDGIPAIFAQEIGEAMTMAARDVRVRVECADGVLPIGSIGKKGAVNGQTMELVIQNLYGLSDKSALFEVQVPAVTGKRTLEVARVTIDYTDPQSGEKMTERQALSVRFDEDQRAVENSVNKDILKTVALTRTSEIKQQAVVLADQGRYNEADTLLQQNSAVLEKTARQCNNDAQLLGEAKQARENTWAANVQKGMKNVFRKRVQAEAQSQISEQYAPGYYDKSSSFWGGK